MNDPLMLARGPEKANPRKVRYEVEVQRRWRLSGLCRRVSYERQETLGMEPTSPLVNGEISPPIDALDEANGAERGGCENALNSSVRSKR